MSDNKIGILNTNLTIEEFVKDNPQYQYSADDDTLSGDKGSWAFVFLNEDTGKIHLTAEQHVPEDMMFDLLNKYGGEYYESEYDTVPTKKIVVKSEDLTVNKLISDASRKAEEVNKADVSKEDIQRKKRIEDMFK